MLSYHQTLTMMEGDKWNSIFFYLLKVVLFTSIFALVIFSPSIVETFPLFQIKHLELNTNNPKVEQIVKSVVEKDFHSNIVFLVFNLALFKDFLQKKSKFYIKGVNLEGFSPFSGTLSLKITHRRPIAIVNSRYFLSKDQYLFDFLGESKKKFNLLQIEDFTDSWQYGKRYTTVDINALVFFYKNFDVRKAKVNKELVLLESKVNKLFLKNADLTHNRIINISNTLLRLNKLVDGKKTIELFGRKAAYVKIFKERNNE